MRVLIIKTSALGDIVHALPVLDFLHKVSPGIEVDWVVEKRFAAILAGNPYISRLHTVDTRRWRNKFFSLSTWREISNIKSELSGRGYNIVFDICSVG